ncbi:hypothetical protein BN130_1654 [Cronobacter malonaticus 507]|nr:hypothetical protein BN130_1654 [Cronobacter malonaticus 507]
MGNNNTACGDSGSLAGRGSVGGQALFTGELILLSDFTLNCF